VLLALSSLPPSSPQERAFELSDLSKIHMQENAKGLEQQIDERYHFKMVPFLLLLFLLLLPLFFLWSSIWDGGER
jgi:hypothetical protein